MRKKTDNTKQPAPVRGGHLCGLLVAALCVWIQPAFAEEPAEPAEPAEVTEAKAKTWEAIYLPFEATKEFCGFYRWTFGEN